MTTRTRDARHDAWKLGRHTVEVTHLDKVFWPDSGLTKGDLLGYYRAVAPLLLPYLRDRPFIMRSWATPRH